MIGKCETVNILGVESDMRRDQILVNPYSMSIESKVGRIGLLAIHCAMCCNGRKRRVQMMARCMKVSMRTANKAEREAFGKINQAMKGKG